MKRIFVMLLTAMLLFLAGCILDSEEDSKECFSNTGCSEINCKSVSCEEGDCVYSEVVECKGSDSCCPIGCNSLNDNNCNPACGNNVVEEGENCENCPEDVNCIAGELCCFSECVKPVCDSDSDCYPSQNAYIVYSCLNPGTCEAECVGTELECIEDTDCETGNSCAIGSCIAGKCVVETISECVSGDGCCAGGCTSINDSDCSAVCGNRVCETGEDSESCPDDCPVQEPNSKTFVLWADTHYGNTERDGAANDIAASVEWIKEKNPDFVFHLGDIVDRGEFAEFDAASADFDEIIHNTPVQGIWFTFGGGHDGYFDQVGSPNWNGAEFLRKRKLTGLWYTIREGNNVFIFCSIVQGKPGWDSAWGSGGGHFIPQNKLDWLEEQLAKYEDTENNIFVIAHTQLYHTNAYSHEWAQMDKIEWQKTSEKLLELFGRYRVDVYVHGHLHIDPDQSYSGHADASAGNVLLNGFRQDLPSTTFIHAGSVDWEHGRERSLKSNYPSVMHFNLVEGNNYFDLKAERVDTSAKVKITYNDGSESAETIKVPLSYPVSGLGSDNEVDYFEQAWSVWRYSDEGDYQWYKDSEGLRTDKNSWIVSRWDLWEPKKITGFSVEWNEKGSLSHEFYCSNNGMATWSEPVDNASDLGVCRWIKVKTSIVPNGTVYIYDMNPETA